MLLKLLICVTFMFVVLKPAVSVSNEQLEKMVKSMRKTCMQKVGVSEDLVNGVSKGEFPDDENLKCYSYCILKAMRGYKNGGIDFAMITKQIDAMLPPDRGALIKVAINSCRSLDFDGDPCEATYKYLKCYYEADPVTFFFP
ncbi:general odorant-binding protein 72-like [Ceratina calcarata]|uniref:General odorant-binding protein 72-like n=1 Tax=Ceratina calcarata TaxID=156304 RepID=A0AAJ7N898_9HYME|nr:general odorant-binding protein 72-like [Ceratina calcarata]